MVWVLPSGGCGPAPTAHHGLVHGPWGCLGLPVSTRSRLDNHLVSAAGARAGPSPAPADTAQTQQVAGPSYSALSTLAARGLQMSGDRPGHLPSLCRLAGTTASLAKGLLAGGLSAFSSLTACVPFRYSGYVLRITRNLLRTPLRRCPQGRPALGVLQSACGLLRPQGAPCVTAQS